MKVTLDQKKCIGCGTCAAVCPDVFEMKGDKAAAKVSETDKKCAKEAAESCAVEAIKVA